MKMRLIDADALKEELNSWAVDLTKSKFPHYVKDDADCIIDNAPTIDAVPRKDYEELERHFVNWEPVVRCKDCKRRKNARENGRLYWGGYEYYCEIARYGVTDDGFCYYGERKDDD